MDTSNGFLPPLAQRDRWSRTSHASNGLNWTGFFRLGSPDAPVVVLIHGTGADCSSWNRLVPHWPEDWTLWALDLPGHGDSPSPPRGYAMGITEIGLSLARLLQNQSLHDREVVLVGHSAGAAVGLQALSEVALAAHWRLIGLAPSLIIPPALYTLALGPTLAPILLSRPSLWLMEASIRVPGVIEAIIRSTGSPLSPERTAQMVSLLRAPGHLEGALRFMSDSDLESVLSRGSQIHAPIALLAAQDDPWIPYEQVRAAAQQFIPRASLSAWPSGGHLFHEHQPEATAQWVADWIAA